MATTTKEKKYDNADNERKAIRNFMNKRQLSVNGWCKRAGMPESTLRSFLNGQSNSMTLQSLMALATIENVALQDMLNLPKPRRVTKDGPLTDGEMVTLIIEKLIEINSQIELTFTEVQRMEHALAILNIAKENNWDNDEDLSKAITAWAIKTMV